MPGDSEHALYNIPLPEDMLFQNGGLLYHARSNPGFGISVISLPPQKVLKNHKEG
jgi:hypothetical protein